MRLARAMLNYALHHDRVFLAVDPCFKYPSGFSRLNSWEHHDDSIAAGMVSDEIARSMRLYRQNHKNRQCYIKSVVNDMKNI